MKIGTVRDAAGFSPSVGSAWGVWKTVSNVSPRSIQDEIARNVQIALIGEPADTKRVYDAWLTDAATESERRDASSKVRFFEATPTEEIAKGFDFLIWVGAPDAPMGIRSRNSVPISGTPEQMIHGMLELRPDLVAALGRRFPLFRLPACARLIRDMARINAQIAFFSALPGVLPITLPFLPVSSIADVVILTKNQVMLLMRLAAVHGQKPGYTKQVRELFGTIAAAMGWRTLAREAAGILPAGAGVALKTAIAYSGTVAAGKTALFFYQRGHAPTAKEIRQFEADARAEAEVAAMELRQARANMVGEGGGVIEAAETPAAESKTDETREPVLVQRDAELPAELPMDALAGENETSSSEPV